MGRSLFTVKITYHNLGYFDITPDEASKNKGALPIHIKCTDEDFKKYLFRYHAKDSLTLPKSERGVTYNKMISEIQDNSHSTFYFWENDYLNFYNSVKKVTIYNESIKISKNIFGDKYILEKDFINETYKSLILKENNMPTNKVKESLYVKFLKSNKSIDQFIEDVVDSGEITPSVNNTNGIQEPEVSIQTSDELLQDDDGAHLVGDTVNSDISTGDNGGISIDPVLAEKSIEEDNAGNGIEVSIQDTEEDEIIDKNITGFVEDFTKSPELSIQPDNKVPEPENKTEDAKDIDAGEEIPKEVDGTGDDGGMSKNDPEEPKLKEDIDASWLDNNSEILGLDVFETDGDKPEDMWADEDKATKEYFVK